MSMGIDERERLYLLMEECGEVVQMCSKVLRYGYEEVYPGDPAARDNRLRLTEEVGDLTAAVKRMCDAKDMDANEVVEQAKDKERTVGRWTKYQPDSAWHKTQEPVKEACNTCLHYRCSFGQVPCIDCHDYDLWEAK